MIRFVVALAAESQPLVELFEMAPEPGAFRWFRSERAALVVSGVGKSASAAATAYLHARTGEKPHAAWLNAGIAGCGKGEIGGAVLAHTVRDGASGRRLHSTHLGGPKLPRVEVVTLDAPESNFPTDGAYDMEASGFYPTALRFSTTELVQVVKIVSDNRETSWSELNPSSVRRLVEGSVDAVALVAAHLEELAAELAPAAGPSPELSDYRTRYRLTTSEERRLERLLARWRALAPAADRGPSFWRGVSRSSELLGRVEEEVNRLARERPL